MAKFRKLDPLARAPQRATEGSAGFDLCARLDDPMEIGPMQRALIPTGIAIELDPGKVGLVYARSGLAIKQGMGMANGVGVIDCDYRGELQVPVINLGNETITVVDGMRIAQMIVSHYYPENMEEVSVLSDTARGEGGFGSTGVDSQPAPQPTQAPTEHKPRDPISPVTIIQMVFVGACILLMIGVTVQIIKGLIQPVFEQKYHHVEYAPIDPDPIYYPQAEDEGSQVHSQWMTVYRPHGLSYKVYIGEMPKPHNVVFLEQEYKDAVVDSAG